MMFHAAMNGDCMSCMSGNCTVRTCLNTFRREHDRFWVLAAHPTLNIFAAGLSQLLLTTSATFLLENYLWLKSLLNDIYWQKLYLSIYLPHRYL